MEAATDPIAAHAAWVLFIRSVDRWADPRMRDDIEAIEAAKDRDEFFDRKLDHAGLNRSTIRRADAMGDTCLDGIFLGRRAASNIAPWGWLQ